MNLSFFIQRKLRALVPETHTRNTHTANHAYKLSARARNITRFNTTSDAAHSYKTDSAQPYKLSRSMHKAGTFATAAGLISVGVALFLRLHDIHFAKTADGIAYIHTVHNESGTPVRVMQLHGAYESATYLDNRRYTPVFTYQRAFDHIFEANLPNQHFLMIGGGGYAWPKHLFASRGVTANKPSASFATVPTLDVVEIDPRMTALAKRWFFLDQLFEEHPDAKQHLNLICDDGRSFLERASHKTNGGYGAIINDTFSGKTPAYTLATLEALQVIKRNLSPDGVYATNVISECEGENISFLRSVVTTACKVFTHVSIIPCEDTDFGLEDNYLVIASDTAYPFTDSLPFDSDFLSEVLLDASFST